MDLDDALELIKDMRRQRPKLEVIQPRNRGGERDWVVDCLDELGNNLTIYSVEDWQDAFADTVRVYTITAKIRHHYRLTKDALVRAIGRIGRLGRHG